MPRTARPVSAETIRIREALIKHIRSAGLTPNAYASLCGVGQWTISRFLSGATKTVTPAVMPALSYAGIDLESSIADVADPIDNPRLRQALEKTWDGSPQMADMLAEIIEAVGPALARCTRYR